MYLLLSSNAGLTMNLHCTVHVESIANVITNPSAIQSNPIQSINQSMTPVCYQLCMLCINTIEPTEQEQSIATA
jgi:hypothetical protein